MVQIKRETKETTVIVDISSENNTQSTTIPFLDHMLDTLARYSNINFSIQANGDDDHHISEDVAITLGKALRQITPDSCSRFGNTKIPMDDALVEVSIDLVERHYYQGGLVSREFEHFFRSFSENYQCNLHIEIIRGFDDHHIIEATFKALGLSLRQAMKDTTEVFSTKGSAKWTIST